MNHHVSLAFKRAKHPQLIPFAQGVHDGLGANPATFTNLPVTLAALLAALTDYTTKYNAAFKGSVAQTEARDAARGVLLGLLATLAAQVEGVAQGDGHIIRSAGFDVASHVRGPQVPMGKPVIAGIKNYAATQIQLRLQTRRHVHGVRVQCRRAGGTWSDGGGFASTKLVIVNNLTPGTLYDFRVQYIGGSTGTSEWSDVVSHICT